MKHWIMYLYLATKVKAIIVILIYFHHDHWRQYLVLNANFSNLLLIVVEILISESINFRHGIPLTIRSLNSRKRNKN